MIDQSSIWPKVLGVINRLAQEEHRFYAERLTYAYRNNAFTISTWRLRLEMNETYPGDEWTCAGLRKTLDVMCRLGLVEKDEYRSRRNNAVWKYNWRKS